jgi:hypothetical protein
VVLTVTERAYEPVSGLVNDQAGPLPPAGWTFGAKFTSLW